MDTIKFQGFIYCIENAVNGKLYVGQTTRSVAARWKQHKQLRGACRALENAILKYGTDAFSLRQIDVADTQEQLDKLEAHYIGVLACRSPRGYNLSKGGGGVGVTHEETKALQRTAALTEERQQILREMRERPDVRAKLAARSKERWVTEGAAVRAKAYTPEARAKKGDSLRLAHANDPTLRERLGAIARVNQNKAEVKAKRSASLKAAWAKLSDAERQERGASISAGTLGVKKTLNHTAEAKANRSAARKQAWASGKFDNRKPMPTEPEFYRLRGEAIRKGIASAKLARVGLNQLGA